MEKFLKEGDKVKVGMMLKGREKAMGEFAKKKIIRARKIRKIITVDGEGTGKRPFWKGEFPFIDPSFLKRRRVGLHR